MRLRPESRIGGAACKSSGSPDPLYGETAIFRLEAAFSFWAVLRGYVLPPPLLGGEGGPGFLLRVRGFVLPNRRSPDGGCAARHLVRMLLCIPYPDDVSRRRFDALCDAGRQAPLRGGVPLAEVCRVPPPMDAVVFGASVKIY